jgi:hypothetical protein
MPMLKRSNTEMTAWSVALGRGGSSSAERGAEAEAVAR